MSEESILKTVMGDAKDRPMDFIRLFTLRAIAHPNGLSIIADALRDLGGLYEQEADALENEINRRKTAKLKSII